MSVGLVRSITEEFGLAAGLSVLYLSTCVFLFFLLGLPKLKKLFKKISLSGHSDGQRLLSVLLPVALSFRRRTADRGSRHGQLSLALPRGAFRRALQRSEGPLVDRSRRRGELSRRDARARRRQGHSTRPDMASRAEQSVELPAGLLRSRGLGRLFQSHAGVVQRAESHAHRVRHRLVRVHCHLACGLRRSVARLDHGLGERGGGRRGHGRLLRRLELRSHQGATSPCSPSPPISRRCSPACSPPCG